MITADHYTSFWGPRSTSTFYPGHIEVLPEKILLQEKKTEDKPKISAKKKKISLVGWATVKGAVLPSTEQKVIQNLKEMRSASVLQKTYCLNKNKRHAIFTFKNLMNSVDQIFETMAHNNEIGMKELVREHPKDREIMEHISREKLRLLSPGSPPPMMSKKRRCQSARNKKRKTIRQTGLKKFCSEPKRDRRSVPRRRPRKKRKKRRKAKKKTKKKARSRISVKIKPNKKIERLATFYNNLFSGFCEQGQLGLDKANKISKPMLQSAVLKLFFTPETQNIFWKLLQVCRAVDKDGNGDIEIIEFLKWLEAPRSRNARLQSWLSKKIDKKFYDCFPKDKEFTFQSFISCLLSTSSFLEYGVAHV